MHDSDRIQWTEYAIRLARPVLAAIANERLRETMPIEAQPGHHASRGKMAHLEAVARVLAGISPWLALGENTEMAAMAQRAVTVGTDPNSPDFFDFISSPQAVVDSAFLAHAILRAPDLLWKTLDDQTRRNLVAAMKATRAIKPYYNNWLLFSAMVEAFLAMAGEPWDPMRVDYAIREHFGWYKGDGVYGDGPNFHWDYYNSYVIHPMMLDLLAEIGKHRSDWKDHLPKALTRAQRYASIQERMIAPDGSFPVIGRSIAYRCGAFQTPAQLALQKTLPVDLPPAQVRAALTAVIHRTLGAANTFDDAGWLRVGLCGHQLSLGETYISTGSVYLCSVALLPLGLPAADEFWSAPPQPFTGQKVWAGLDLPADHAIAD